MTGADLNFLKELAGTEFQDMSLCPILIERIVWRAAAERDGRVQRRLEVRRSRKNKRIETVGCARSKSGASGDPECDRNV